MLLEAAHNIQGWMSNTELAWLAQRAKEAEIIFEYGCYKGRSTRALADNTPGIVYAIDPWDGFYPCNDGQKHSIDTNVYPEFERNLQDHIESGKVIPIKDFSWSFKPLVKADFIFIDGDHRFDAVMDDIKHALKYINSWGIIAGHDYGHNEWYGVKQAVDTMFPGKFEVIDSIWSVKL